MVRGIFTRVIGVVALAAIPLQVLFPVQAHANTPLSCEDIFGVSLKAKALSEFETALARWKSPAPAGIVKQQRKISASRNIAVIAPKPTAPASLSYAVQVAPLDPLRAEASFFKKGAEKDAEIDPFGSPSDYSIAQLLVTRDSIAIIRPNIAKSILTDFGTAPLRARLNPDGTFTDLGPLFRGVHSLSATPPKYHYTLSMNLQTTTARAILTIDEQREANYSEYQMGRADAFFVSPKTGFEYPSLAKESGYRFNNVVALSDTLYFAEVAKNSPRGDQGDCIFFEYDPAAYTYQRLIEFSLGNGTNPSDLRLLASLLRQRRNRDVAQGSVGLDHLLTVLTQTHLIRVELPDPDPSGHFTGALSVSPLAHREPGTFPHTPESPLGRSAVQIKVVATQSTAPTKYFEMLMYTGERYDPRRGPATQETLVVRLDSSGEPRSWKVQADRLSPIFYRVRGGFIAQRDGFNPRATASFPPGHLRGLVFLADNGDVHDVGETLTQSYGAVSIIDGNIFLIGPGGRMLHIGQRPDWR